MKHRHRALRCLTEAIWSLGHPAVQVVSYRILKSLEKSHLGPKIHWSMVYFDETTQNGQKTLEDAVRHVDSNETY